MWEFKVGKTDRLDRSLRNQGLPGSEWLSRQAWEWLIAQGRVSVNGRKAVKSGENLAVGDQIRISLPGPLGLLPAQKVAEPVWISPDRAWAAFSKPTGLDTVSLLPWDGECFASQVAAFAAREGLPFAELSAPPSLEGGLLQRLDRETSGLLCAAFDTAVKARFREMFSSGDVEKAYLALVTGPVQAGDFEVWFAESHGPKVRASLEKPRGEAEMVRLGVEVRTQSGKGALILVRTRQGRRHVVRAGLAALGAPLLGDQVYGGSAAASFYQLHASGLRFPDSPGSLEAPPPQGFLDSCAILGIKYPG